MHAVVASEPLVELDYAVVVDAESLLESASVADLGAVRLLVAAQVGPVRLIDNSAAQTDADAVRPQPDATDTTRQLERIG